MDEIEYGVFGKTYDNDEWNVCYTWTSSYEDAYYVYKQTLANPR
ncbi:MAG: hypothetical protein ACI3XQ_11350 [Eubacteriales bacterium]